jgi:hypothetical protein
VKVNTKAQEFDRLPARPVSQQLQTKSAPDIPPRIADVAQVERATSVSEAGREPQDALQADMVAAHVEWCSSRYRSYRSYDNSYTPYSGGRRECISPYFGAGDGSIEPSNIEQTTYRPSEERVEFVYATEDYVSRDHQAYCFSRYRSYRPEDNTYQPYDGGPRRQCR